MSVNGPRSGYSVRWGRLFGLAMVGFGLVGASTTGLLLLDDHTLLGLAMLIGALGIICIVISMVVTIYEVRQINEKRKEWEQFRERRNSRRFRDEE